MHIAERSVDIIRKYDIVTSCIRRWAWRLLEPPRPGTPGIAGGVGEFPPCDLGGTPPAGTPPGVAGAPGGQKRGEFSTVYFGPIFYEEISSASSIFSENPPPDPPRAAQNPTRDSPRLGGAPGGSPADPLPGPPRLTPTHRHSEIRTGFSL